MKKTVFFVTSLNSGGIENYLLRFLKHYDGNLLPIVICKGNSLGELSGEYQEIKNIKLIKMNLGYFNLNSYFKIYSILKNEGIDSIVDFTGNFAGLIMLVGNFAGIKKRITFYRGSTNRFKETKMRLVYDFFIKRITQWNSTRILSNSKSALDFFYPKRNQNSKKYSVIYNGIDATKFNLEFVSYKKTDFGIPEDAFVIGHTGRYDKAKNHTTILKVAEKIVVKYPKVYFVLCGKNTDKFLSENVSEGEIFKSNIKSLGYRKDINQILPVFDLFFFPSITEGQPNSLIEAMIVGLPIVASDINPIKETTPTEIHNELIAPLNVELFCERIESYYLSASKRQENNFSNWAKQRFNPDVLFDQFYKEL
ncbi:glycosyltransferase [Flavobacterium sp.]|uniref:glycosyltransferase n=1 Tax=Flavobacterium sp. TaxID=239 RepID=UPI00260A9CA9|nr:glycosyltransferase [Flavobacterium sp.]